MTQHLGVFGGLFDPIHLGHLRVALEVYEALALSEVLFVPCGQPVHRAAGTLDAHQRLALVEQAVATHPHFRVCDWEVQRDAPSYMVDTLTHLRAQHPDATLTLIVGADAFAHILSWKAPDTILGLANIVVVSRKASPLWSEALQQWVTEHESPSLDALGEAPFGRIASLSLSDIPIASTQVRHLLAQKKSVQYLLPEAVYDYIEKRGWYR